MFEGLRRVKEKRKIYGLSHKQPAIQNKKQQGEKKKKKAFMQARHKKPHLLTFPTYDQADIDGKHTTIQSKKPSY